MTQEKRDYRTVPRLVRTFLPGSERVLALAAIFAVGSAVVELVLPWSVYRLLLRILDGAETPSVAVLALAATGSVVATYVLRGFSVVYSHIAAFDVICRVRFKLGRVWAHAPLSKLERGHSSQARAAGGEHVERLDSVIAHAIPEVIAGVVVWVAMTVWMFIEDWRLALATAVMVPIAFGTMSVAMRSTSHRMGAWSVANAEMSMAIMDQLSAARELRVFGTTVSTPRTAGAVARNGALQRAWGAAFLRWGAWFYPLIAAGPAVVLVLGTWLFVAGEIELQTMLLFAVLAPPYTIPLTTMFNVYNQLPLVGMGANVIVEQLDIVEQADGDGSGTPTGASLSFHDVTFSYPGADRPALNRVSITVEEGTTLAVVGGSGSGKTTLLELASRLREPADGVVRLGGAKLDTLTAAQLYRSIGVVAQRPFLFPGTIAENLRLGRQDADDETLWDALEMVGLADEVTGLDYHLGEGGAGLSGGQQQRLAVARALVADRPVLLLDEPTASIDPVAERRLLTSLEKLCADRTVLIVTHRLMTALRADQIVVMDNGRIVQTGRHDDLINEAGLYAELWDAEVRTRQVKGVSA